MASRITDYGCYCFGIYFQNPTLNEQTVPRRNYSMEHCISQSLTFLKLILMLRCNQVFHSRRHCVLVSVSVCLSLCALCASIPWSCKLVDQEHECWRPKVGELCLESAKSGETLVGVSWRHSYGFLFRYAPATHRDLDCGLSQSINVETRKMAKYA